MRALDTNVLVRLIARDDDNQLERAERLLSEPFVILPTVILETVWVLRTRYGMRRAELAKGIRLVLGHQQAWPVSGDALLRSVEAYEQGGDYADLLHLALAAEAEASSFATFDRKLTKTGPDTLPVEAL